jgi:hypothetical protein
MNENWVMLAAGALLVWFGFAATDVRSAMPGASPGHPPSRWFRFILIFFGVLMSVLGMVRLYD